MIRPASITVLLCTPCLLLAEVGDPNIRTDHPDYPGEGAFQSVEDCVRFATGGKSAEQEKAIALYLWMLKHQYHLMSPQERCVPGRTPDTAKPGDYEMVVFDANRARFSYGYGLCGTVHAWNEPYWHALGMRARRRAFPGHVNSEVRYGGSWHAFKIGPVIGDYVAHRVVGEKKGLPEAGLSGEELAATYTLKAETFA